MPRPPRADEAGWLYHALNRGNLRIRANGSGLFDLVELGVKERIRANGSATVLSLGKC